MKWNLGQCAKIKQLLAGILPPVSWDFSPSLPLLCLSAQLSFLDPNRGCRGRKAVLEGIRTHWAPPTLAPWLRSIDPPVCSDALWEVCGVEWIRPSAVLIALHLLVPGSIQPPSSQKLSSIAICSAPLHGFCDRHMVAPSTWETSVDGHQPAMLGCKFSEEGRERYFLPYLFIPA